MTLVLTTGSFDPLDGHHVRFLEEAAQFGTLHVLLWDAPDTKFPVAERRYFLEALRFVDQVTEVALNPLLSDQWQCEDALWIWPEGEGSASRQDFCTRRGIPFRVIAAERLIQYPAGIQAPEGESPRKKVIVTGCFDYLHSGHVRFFEQASQFGDLYVIVGSDANLRLLKGQGHPLFPQEQRRHLTGAVRYVKQSLISTGQGWMDAAPEIESLRPDIYLVNEDGDKPEKRQFCAEHGLEYVVLQRTPAPGLPRRSSTDLRGF